MCPADWRTDAGETDCFWGKRGRTAGVPISSDLQNCDWSAGQAGGFAGRRTAVGTGLCWCAGRRICIGQSRCNSTGIGLCDPGWYWTNPSGRNQSIVFPWREWRNDTEKHGKRRHFIPVWQGTDWGTETAVVSDSQRTVIFAAFLSVSEYDKTLWDIVSDLCQNGYGTESDQTVLFNWNTAETV